jgi:hypothetical protein
VRTPLLLYALALVVRAALIALFPYPAYPDSEYYVDVARQLHAGNGFNVDFIWIFAEVGGKIPADPTLPIPSNAHWMPLASIVQVPFLAVFGDAPWAAAAPFALIGAIAAPLTWAIARDAGARRSSRSVPASWSRSAPVGRLHAAARQLLALPAAGHRVAVDGGPGASRLGPGVHRRRAVRGLATLARNDGLLVLAALGLVFLWDRWRAWRRNRAGDAIRPAIPFAAAVGAVAVFVLVMAPWWARQLAVFGSLSPSSTSGKVLFIRDIGEWNSITIPASLDHLLSMGAGPLLATRIGGGIAAVMIFLTLVLGFVLGPLLVVGAWARRRSTDFGPFFVYARSCSRSRRSSPRSTCRAARSSTRRSRLAPYCYILALEGIVVAVGWVAARRRNWNADSAIRVFGGATLAFAAVLAITGNARRPRDLVRPSRRLPRRDDRARRRRRADIRPGHVDRRRGDEVLDRAVAAWSSSTTRSTRSTRSPRPTTSAGSSSTGVTRSPASHRSSTAPRTRPGSASRSWPRASRRGSPSTRCSGTTASTLATQAAP